MKIANVTNYSFKANKMTKQQAECLNSALVNSNGVDIICHDLTDMDAANSALLMWEYLKQKGVNSRVILRQNVNSLNLRNTNCNVCQADSYDTKPIGDTALCVDFSSIGRMYPSALDTYCNTDNKVCIDHHTNQDLFSEDDCVDIKKHLNESQLPDKVSKHYIDSSAKSTTSIIYRFFEALGEDVDEDRAYDIMSGFMSDCTRRGLVVCNEQTRTIIPTDEFKNDKNAYEIFQKLSSILPEKKLKQIAKNIDVMANLSTEENNFYKSLFNRLKFNDDGTIAYIELTPSDEDWQKLGGKTLRNSTIINNFRQNVLNSKKYPKIKDVIVFYSAGDTYRLSIHSKNKDLVDMYTYAYENLSDKYDSFSIGGHKTRGGGKILSNNEDECHKFVEDIVACIENSRSI